MKYNPNRGRCFSGAEIAAYRARQRIRQMQRQQQIREMAARKQSTVKKRAGKKFLPCDFCKVLK